MQIQFSSLFFFSPLSRRSRKPKPPFLVTCGEWETSREKTSQRRLCRSAPCGCQAQGSRRALLPSQPSGWLPRGHKMRQTRITLPGILNNWHFWKGLHLRWFCFCFVFSGSHIKKDGKPCFREHGLFWLFFLVLSSKLLLCSSHYKSPINASEYTFKIKLRWDQMQQTPNFYEIKALFIFLNNLLERRSWRY